MTGRTVAVVGAGYSGTIAALELARRGAQVVLIERSDRYAAGAAYGTRAPMHLLNVRAANMSAFDGAPEHFETWLQAEGLGGARSFAPRRDYHRYLAELLDQAVQAGGVRLLQGEAAEREAGALRLGDGQRIGCNAVVLAGGNYPSHLPAMLRGPTAVEDPWGPGGAESIAALAAQSGDILLLGTGLTMVDVALSLAEAGYAGRMVATSRRGLVPRAHEEPAAAPLPAPEPAPLAQLVRQVRTQSRGGNWRAAIDSLRPVSQDIWRGLGEADKGRFLRHLRPWWDVHRHRIAPQVAARVEALRASGQLDIVPGRIVSVENGNVAIVPRGGGTDIKVEAAGVVNCTGPEGRIAKVEDALIRSLLVSGAARPDRFGMGLDVDAEARVIGADGRASEGLYALGPLTRGTFWEIVAVPDIRGQARRVAERAAAY